MTLLEFKEKIHTDCSQLSYLILDIQAIKFDAAKADSLKNVLNCSAFSSCDYLRKKNNALYFIELSDLKYEISNYENDGFNRRDAIKKSKDGIRQKLSDSMHIYIEMAKKFNIDDSKIKYKKVLLAICQSSQADVIALSVLANNLEQHYKPTLYTSIKLIPYTELENIFKR